MGRSGGGRRLVSAHLGLLTTSCGGHFAGRYASPGLRMDAFSSLDVWVFERNRNLFPKAYWAKSPLCHSFFPDVAGMIVLKSGEEGYLSKFTSYVPVARQPLVVNFLFYFVTISSAQICVWQGLLSSLERLRFHCGGQIYVFHAEAPPREGFRLDGSFGWRNWADHGTVKIWEWDGYG